MIDTYESAEAPVETDELAKFREQVQQEDEKPVRKMSEKAIAKLRASAEQSRLENIAGEEFANRLKKVTVTPDSLGQLIAQAGMSTAQLDRRVEKLIWWINAGFQLGREINSVSLINFFSILSGDEPKMSAKEFTQTWNMEYAAKFKASRIRRGVIAEDPKPVVVEVEPPAVRLCKSGQKCLQLKARKPARAKGRGEYCSPNCAGSDRARAKRLLVADALGKTEKAAFCSPGAA